MSPTAALRQAKREISTVYRFGTGYFYNRYLAQYDAYEPSRSYHSYALAVADRKWDVVSRALQLLTGDESGVWVVVCALRDTEAATGAYRLEEALRLARADWQKLFGAERGGRE